MYIWLFEQFVCSNFLSYDELKDVYIVYTVQIMYKQCTVVYTRVLDSVGYSHVLHDSVMLKHGSMMPSNSSVCLEMYLTGRSIYSTF